MTTSDDHKGGTNLRAGGATGSKETGDANTVGSAGVANDGGGMSAEEVLITQVAAQAKLEAEAAEKAKAKTKTGAETGAKIGEDDSATDAGKEGEGSGRVEGEVTLEERVLDLEDRLSRALAEGENSRRRLERDRADALRYGASKLAMDMFEVADNLRRACSFVSEEARARDEGLRNLVIGIEMTEKILVEAFVRHGIESIAPNVGDAFNAEEHQAVSEVEGGKVKEGCVVEVILRGYRMGERLLRPAQVVTAKSKRTDAETEKTAENAEELGEEEKK